MSKTLGELAKELSSLNDAEPNDVLLEASGRLAAIERTWRAFDGMTEGNYTEARRRVRNAIEGKEP